MAGNNEEPLVSQFVTLPEINSYQSNGRSKRPKFFPITSEEEHEISMNLEEEEEKEIDKKVKKTTD